MSARLRDVHPIIKQIIDRDCHVGTSDREVVLHVIEKLKEGMTSFQKMSATDQRRFVQQCLIQHRRNQQLYQAVMSGFRSSLKVDGSIETLATSLVTELMTQGEPSN